MAGVGDEVARVDEHPHRHEEQDGEGLPERQHVRADLMAQRRLRDHDPGQEGAEGDRHAEKGGRGQGDPERQGEGDEQEQLARLHARDPQEDPGHDARPQQQHERDEHGGLEEREAEGRRGPAGRARRQRGQDQQEQYGGQVLEHQPADGNASVPAVEEPLVHQAPEEDDGAGDGDGEPEHDAGFARPAPPPAHTVAEGSGDRHLAQRPRYRHPAHAPQVAQREVQADAEHQEDDAQLGELADGVHVADEARGEGPDGHPGHEIADDRRHPRAPGQQPAHEGRGQGDTDVDEKRDLVHGRAPSQRFAASAAEQAASTRRSRRPTSSRRTLAPTARARDGRSSGSSVHATVRAAA